MTNSVSGQIRSNSQDLNFQLLQGALEVSSKIRNIETPSQETVYAKEGDEKYDEAMDENGDGTITYDEYMKYCEANAVSRYSENPGKTVVAKTEATEAGIQSIRPINIGKALSTYFSSESPLPEAKIASEA